MPDIDIDVGDNFKADPTWIRASIISDSLEFMQDHPSGYYLYKVPKYRQLAAIPYNVLENDYNVNKVDFLHNTSYDKYKSRSEVERYLEMEPDWTLLNDEEIVNKLPHINNYFELLQQFNIKDLHTLADFIALIRPGKKRLIREYLKNPSIIRKILYNKVENYYFKKSHAFGYANLIKLELNYIKEHLDE